MKQPKKHRRRTCGVCHTVHTVVNHKWLQWKRAKTGLGQHDVARTLEMSPSFISHIETGHRLPPPEVVKYYNTL